MLFHRLQQTQRELREVGLTFHLADGESEIRVDLPLRAIALEFGDQATQVCNPVEEGSGFSLRWHWTAEILQNRGAREK
jgi:hypothetical protein